MFSWYDLALRLTFRHSISWGCPSPGEGYPSGSLRCHGTLVHACGRCPWHMPQWGVVSFWLVLGMRPEIWPGRVVVITSEMKMMFDWIHQSWGGHLDVPRCRSFWITVDVKVISKTTQSETISSHISTRARIVIMTDASLQAVSISNSANKHKYRRWSNLVFSKPKRVRIFRFRRGET